MTAMDWPQIGFLTLTVACVIGLLVIRRILKLQRQLTKRLDALECVLKNTRLKHEQLSSQLDGQRVGLGELQQRLQKWTPIFEARAAGGTDLEHHRGVEGKLYQRATRMVALGASLEELMTECDLPQAEAELFLSLQKHKETR